MSHNYGIHGKSGSPDDLIADHRCCIFPEISPENGIVSAEIFCPEFYLIFSHSFQNAPCNFNDTGCYCCQCGSGNLHSWHSEQSIDQHCIDKNIYYYTGGTDHAAFCRSAAVFQDAEIHLRASGKQIGYRDHTKIQGTAPDQYRIIGKDPHQHSRDQQRGQSKDQRDHSGNFHYKGKDPLHCRNISLSPVLGCDKRKADGHCFQKKIVDKCYLPCQRYCGKRIL